jgi:2-polyprenyl-3-methyl-5-hydroxy-6-metoxy-1,4-benzoquinol methylase
MNADSQEIQSQQYSYPYHHIPYVKGAGDGVRIRMLNWGFEYLICKERLVDLIAREKPKAVLDVGCGDGALLGALPASIKARIGIDTNPRAISFARAFFPDVEFRCGNIDSVQETFDIVCAIEVLEHIPDNAIGDFLEAIASCIAPGGALLISVPTSNEPVNHKHFRHYDLESLMQQTERPLTGIVLEYVEYFYVRTMLEHLYQKLTQNPLIYGELPFLRRFVYRYARRCAVGATKANGVHLIAKFRRLSVNEPEKLNRI